MLFSNNCDFKKQVQTCNTYRNLFHMPELVSNWSKKMIQTNSK